MAEDMHEISFASPKMAEAESELDGPSSSHVEFLESRILLLESELRQRDITIDALRKNKLKLPNPAKSQLVPVPAQQAGNSAVHVANVNPYILCDVRYVTRKEQSPGSGVFNKVGEETQIVTRGVLPSYPPPLTVTTDFSATGFKTNTVLKIESRGLVNLMTDAMRSLIDHEGQTIWIGPEVSFGTKYAPICYSYDELLRLAEKPRTMVTDAATTDSHDQLKTLLYVLRQAEPDFFLKKATAMEMGEVLGTYLWTIFPPGAEVITYVLDNQIQMLIVDRFTYQGRNGVVTAWCYDWDGSELVRTYYDLAIPAFDKPRRIATLAVFPLRFAKDPDALRESLKLRGMRFQKLCFTPERGNRICTYGTDTGNSSKVILDASMYLRHSSYTQNWFSLGTLKSTRSPVCKCKLCDLDGYRSFVWEHDFMDAVYQRVSFPQAYMSPQSEASFCLLPSRVLAYYLDRKEWVQIPVTSVEEFTFEDPHKGWNDLVLKDQNKNILRSLVISHYENQKMNGNTSGVLRDIVPDKGTGLVILLHGIPGVGKTLTAETLAMSLTRPLLRIDASDFDYNSSKQVSNALQFFFSLASVWRAILLLDEADVFLQLRSRAELQQNALVAVLLRQLEYFRGVCILTTNRVRTIDHAMQSRIHFGLKFLRQTEDELTKVWQKFSSQLCDDNSTEEERMSIAQWFESNKSELTNAKLNGRELRNIFLTAQLLDHNMMIKKINIEYMARAIKNFVGDLSDIRSQYEDKGAAGMREL